MQQEFGAITLAHRNGLRLSVGDFVEIMPTNSSVKTHVIFLSAIASDDDEELLLNGPSFYAFRDDESGVGMELFFDQERRFYSASRALHVVSLRIKTGSANAEFDGPTGTPSYVARSVRDRIDAKSPFPAIEKDVLKAFLTVRIVPPRFLPVAVLDDPCLRYWEGCDAQTLTFDEWQALNRMSETIPSLSLDALAFAWLDPDSKQLMHPAIYGLACILLALTRCGQPVTDSLKFFVRGFAQNYPHRMRPAELLYEAKNMVLFATHQVRDIPTPIPFLYQLLAVFVTEKRVMGPYLAHLTSQLLRKILMKCCNACGELFPAPLRCGEWHYCSAECQEEELCANHETSRGYQVIWLLDDVDQAKTAEEHDVLMTRVNALRS